MVFMIVCGTHDDQKSINDRYPQDINLITEILKHHVSTTGPSLQRYYSCTASECKPCEPRPSARNYTYDQQCASSKCTGARASASSTRIADDRTSIDWTSCEACPSTSSRPTHNRHEFDSTKHSAPCNNISSNSRSASRSWSNCSPPGSTRRNDSDPYKRPCGSGEHYSFKCPSSLDSRRCCCCWRSCGRRTSSTADGESIGSIWTPCITVISASPWSLFQ